VDVISYNHALRSGASRLAIITLYALPNLQPCGLFSYYTYGHSSFCPSCVTLFTLDLSRWAHPDARPRPLLDLWPASISETHRRRVAEFWS